MGLSRKTRAWLAAHAGASLAGKTVLVTGANSGVGFKTAEIALYLGAKVILACRDPERARRARSALLEEAPGAAVAVMPLDLASLASIDAFADALRDGRADVDVFVNNAGACRHPGEKTAEGFDLVMGTNYLGTYYLTERALPYLLTLPHPVWVVNTVSVALKAAGRVDFDDFYCKKHPGGFAVYARSKLCLAKYTLALAERCAGTNVRALMNHPGVAITPLAVNGCKSWVVRAAYRLRFLFNSPEKSALSLACILSRDVPPGSLVGPSRGFGGWGYPQINRLSRRLRRGTEALLRFTEAEIRKAAAHREAP